MFFFSNIKSTERSTVDSSEHIAIIPSYKKRKKKGYRLAHVSNAQRIYRRVTKTRFRWFAGSRVSKTAVMTWVRNALNRVFILFGLQTTTSKRTFAGRNIINTRRKDRPARFASSSEPAVRRDHGTRGEEFPQKRAREIHATVETIAYTPPSFYDIIITIIVIILL